MYEDKHDNDNRPESRPISAKSNNSNNSIKRENSLEEIPLSGVYIIIIYYKIE